MSQRAFQLSLRDLLWLLLLTAIGVGWHVERQSALAALSKTAHKSRLTLGPFVAEPQAERLALAAKIRSLSDAELVQGFRSSFQYRFDYSGAKCQLYMTELAHRGLTDELQREYEEFSARSGMPNLFPGAGLLLTALARARSPGEPDPVKVIVRVRSGINGVHLPPQLDAEVQPTNHDLRPYVAVLSFRHHDERWQVLLIDASGQRVPFSSVHDWQHRTPTQFLDARHYLKPPKSGRYQLQVLFNANNHIAKSSDLTGLIVWKSDPIWVEVVNHLDADRQISALPPLLVLGLTALLWLGWQLRRRSNVSAGDAKTARPWSWRNWLPPLLIAAALAGWFLNLRHLRNEIVRVTPDSEANWTMRPVEGPESR